MIIGGAVNKVETACLFCLIDDYAHAPKGPSVLFFFCPMCDRFRVIRPNCAICASCCDALQDGWPDDEVTVAG